MGAVCGSLLGGGDHPLVKAVYPKGKALASGTNVPDSNNLGKLAFSCQSNPSQLDKVAQGLLRNARADVRAVPRDPKAKARLCVTLAILKKLIVECHKDLSFFAREAVEIIELAIGVRAPSVMPGSVGGRRDIEISERAAGAFHAFATYAEQTSIGIDQTITGLYLSCLAQFSSLAKEPYTDDSHIPGERLVGLHAIEGAVSSDILFTAHFEDQARHILPALIFNVLPNDVMDLEILQELSQEDTRNKEFHHSLQKRRPHHERKARSIRSGKEAEKTPTERDVAIAAIKTLKTLFGSSHSAQLTASIEATVTWLSNYNNGAYWSKVDWCCWLADSVTLWTHLQYRFVIVGAFLDGLSSKIHIDESSGAGQTSLVAMITAILNSDTSLVGLGIGDVLSQISELITRRARLGPGDPLLPKLAGCIAALATHVYYADQISDMVQDLVNAITTLQNRDVGDGQDTSSTATRISVRVHVQALYLVLRMSRSSKDVYGAITESSKKERHDKSKKAERDKRSGRDAGKADDQSAPVIRVAHTGRRAPITPAIFQETLFLMVDADAATRANYLHALLLYLKYELPSVTSEGFGREATLRFFHALHAYAYELATSRSLGFSSSRPTSRPASIRRSSRAGSRKASITGSVPEASLENVASPANFALLRDVLVAVHSTQSCEAAIAGLPMLFALESTGAGSWPADTEGARRQATLEVAKVAFGAAGHTWGVNVAAPPASSVLPTSVPYESSASGASRFGGPNAPTRSSPSSATPEAFAASSSLQTLSGLSQAELSAGLSGLWSVESAMQRSGRNTTPYAQGTLRIISTTSLAAMASNGHSGSPNGRSLRSPSVADLKATLEGDPSSPTSPNGRAPSIRSRAVSELHDEPPTTGSPVLHRRKSSRIPKAEALALLDKVADAPIRSNRLSVVSPPYA